MEYAVLMKVGHVGGHADATSIDILFPYSIPVGVEKVKQVLKEGDIVLVGVSDFPKKLMWVARVDAFRERKDGVDLSDIYLPGSSHHWPGYPDRLTPIYSNDECKKRYSKTAGIPDPWSLEGIEDHVFHSWRQNPFYKYK